MQTPHNYVRCLLVILTFNIITGISKKLDNSPTNSHSNKNYGFNKEIFNFFHNESPFFKKLLTNVA